MYKYIMAVLPKKKCFDFSYIEDIRFQRPRVGCILVPFGKIKDSCCWYTLPKRGIVYTLSKGEIWDSNVYI